MTTERVPKKETLEQMFSKIKIRVSLTVDGTPIIKDMDKYYLEKVKEWLQQEQTDFELRNKSSGVVLSILEQIFGKLLEDLE